jgi:hypothetical protein
MRLERVRPVLIGSAIVAVVAIVAGCSSTAPTAPPTVAPTAAAASLALSSAAPSTATSIETATASASETPTAAPPTSAAPTAEPTTAPSESPIPTIGNVAGTANQLSELSSYKVSMTTTGGTAPGNAEFIVIRKPVLKESYTLAFGTKTTRVVVIGQDTWIDAGTGKFSHNTIPAAATQQMTSAFEPAVFLAAIAKAVDLSKLTTVGVEDKNGIQSVHLHGDQNTVIAAGKPTIPPGGMVDVWVSANPQFLVALEWSGMPSTNGGATAGQIEVTNVNDPALDVLPPD